MLQQLRAASKSWVASVIIGVLVLAFALWGVADIFRGTTDNVVAEVGDTKIFDLEYDQQLRAQMRALSDQMQTAITLEEAKAFGLDRSVLDQAISRAALDEVVNSLRLTASRETIAAQIRANPAFRGVSGTFDPMLFLRTLQDNGLSEDAFVAVTGRDIAREQLLTAASAGMIAPPGFTRLLYDFANETRVIEYLVVTPDDAGRPGEPSAADVEAYYRDHPAEFTAPEYRTFSYVQIGPDQVAGEIEITDDELMEEYEARKAEFDRPEQREVQQIVFPDKASADAAAARIRTAEDFAAVARERGLNDEDLRLGTFAASGLDPRLSAAVFAVPEGGVTEPVQGPFGWVILRAARVIPAETQSFDLVQDRLRADLINARAGARITDLANALEDERGAGLPLDEAAERVGLTVVHVDGADRQGETPERTPADIPPDPAFLEQLFLTDVGEETSLFSGQGGQYFAIRVTGVTPPAVRPFDSVREEAREAYMADARRRMLQEKVQQLIEQATKSGGLAEPGRTLRRAPVKTMPMKRGDTNDVFSPQLMAQLFGSPAETLIQGPAAVGDGYVLARVIEVNHPEPDVSSPDYANFRRVAAQQLGETAIESLAADARRQAGVNIHEATLRRVLGEVPQ